MTTKSTGKLEAARLRHRIMSRLWAKPFCMPLQEIAALFGYANARSISPMINNLRFRNNPNMKVFGR